MDDLELARACAALADDKKAENIRIIDLRGLSPITDWMVLCTAMSAPQLRAVRDNIVDEMKELHDQRPRVTVGNHESQWIIVDYTNVMVHILTPEKREYYALEELWGDAPEVSLEAAKPEPEPKAKAKPKARKVAKSKK